MTLNPPRAIRPGTAFRDGKLYEFYRDGIIVLSRCLTCGHGGAPPRVANGCKSAPICDCVDSTRLGPAKYPAVNRRFVPSLKAGTSVICWLADRTRQTRIPIRIPTLMKKIMVEQNFLDPPAFPGDFPFLEPAWVAALRTEYLKPIPEEVLAAVAPFSTRHWHLLNLIARCPGALDLVRATPSRAFALASLWAFRQPAPRQPLRSARSLLRKRQSEIATWLGFPGERSTVHVLRKLAPAECTIPNLLHLRDLFPHFSEGPPAHANPYERSALHHGPQPWPIHPVRHLPRGTRCLTRTRMATRESGLLRDVLWLRETIGEAGVFAIHSHDHRQRIHDRLVERIGRMDLKLLFTDPLPDPPFPTITLVTSNLSPSPKLSI